MGPWEPDAAPGRPNFCQPIRETGDTIAFYRDDDVMVLDSDVELCFQLRTLPDPVCFSSSSTSMAYVSAVSELLPAASRQLHEAAYSSQTATTGRDRAGNRLEGSSSACSSGAIDAAAAASQLRPLGQHPFLLGLWSGVEGAEGGVEAFARMCDIVIGKLPEIVKDLLALGVKNPGRWMFECGPIQWCRS